MKVGSTVESNQGRTFNFPDSSSKGLHWSTGLELHSAILGPCPDCCICFSQCIMPEKDQCQVLGKLAFLPVDTLHLAKNFVWTAQLL